MGGKGIRQKITALLYCSVMLALSMHGAEEKRKVARKRSQESFVVGALLQNTPLPTELCTLVFAYYGVCKVKETPMWNYKTGECVQQLDDAGSHCVRLSSCQFISCNKSMLTVWEHSFNKPKSQKKTKRLKK